MRIRRITHAGAAHRHQATCMYWDHMTGWGWTMMLLWAILLVVLVAGVIWAMLASSRPAGPAYERQASSPPSARELLDERLARGEIDTDEYEQRRRALEGSLTRG